MISATVTESDFTRTLPRLKFDSLERTHAIYLDNIVGRFAEIYLKNMYKYVNFLEENNFFHVILIIKISFSVANSFAVRKLVKYNQCGQ